MFRHLLVVAAIFMGAGISGYSIFDYVVKHKIESRWAPLDETTLKQQAEARLVDQVASVPNPNAAFFLPADVVAPLIEEKLASLKGVKKSAVSFREDLILTEVDFELTDENSKEEAADLKKLNNYRVAGTLKVSVTPLLDLSNNQIRFMYAFTVTDLSSAEVAGVRVPESLVESVASLLTRYLNNINGILNKECTKPANEQAVNVSSCIAMFPTTIVNRIDLKESLQANPTTKSASSESLNLSVEIKSAALAVMPKGIYLIARLSGVAFGSGGEATSPNKPTQSSTQAARKHITEMSHKILGQPPSKELRVGIKTELPARAVEYVAAASQLAFTSAIDSPAENIPGSEVRLAKKPEFECSRISCSRQECRKPNCYSRTDRSCVNDGGDIARIINTVCSTVVNTVCEGGRAASDLICNTVQELSVASCNIGEELKKAGCNGNKIFVDKVFGRIGEISGDYKINGTYSVTLDSARVSSDFTRIDAVVTASASAKAEGSLKFTPMDHGHLLACIAQWQEKYSVNVSIPEARREIYASRNSVEYLDATGLKIQFAVEPFEITGRVSPSPFDAVFNQHPHLRLNCQLPTAIGDLAKFVKVIDPESSLLPDGLNQAVTGNVRKKVENTTFTVLIPNFKTAILEKAIILKPALNSDSLVYAGSI